MAEGTLIGWTDTSWPIVAGCEPVSPGCLNCWSAQLTSTRLRHLPAYAGLAVDGQFIGEVRPLWERLTQPLHTVKAHRRFVSSAGDLLHRKVPDEFIAATFAVMAVCPHITFQVLTKHQIRLRLLLNSDWFRVMVANLVPAYAKDPDRAQDYVRTVWPLPNVHVGVSVENDAWARVRIQHLRRTPAAVRWISAEPLIGPITHDLHGLDWVVVGGESGRNYRPMDVPWLTGLVDRSRALGIPVYVKQDADRFSGRQGRIPDEYWIHEYPRAVPAGVGV